MTLESNDENRSQVRNAAGALDQKCIQKTVVGLKEVYKVIKVVFMVATVRLVVVFCVNVVSSKITFMIIVFVAALISGWRINFEIDAGGGVEEKGNVLSTHGCLKRWFVDTQC